MEKGSGHLMLTPGVTIPVRMDGVRAWRRVILTCGTNEIFIFIITSCIAVTSLIGTDDQISTY